MSAPRASIPPAAPLEYTTNELLAEDAYQEPLVAGGVRCHGGFIENAYVSPRGLHRRPAIAAWQGRLRAEGQPLIGISDAYVPPQYPSYEQAKLLLQEGIVDPITRSLTIVAIVEGFGARIRDVPLPDFEVEIKEGVAGTALAHLGSGLFEAHARDEAGHRDRGGHKQMWEAARDLGLDRPEIPDDVLLRMMLGRAREERPPLFPELSRRMENAIAIMANVLVVEVFAENVFEWASRLLGDPEVSANPEAAARIVSYIREDEKPHVAYLRTALSELRCRTLLSAEGGRELQGAEVVDRIVERQLRGIASTRPSEQRERLREEIRGEIADRAGSDQLARRFEELDSGWVFPCGDDERVDLILASP